MQKLTKAAIIIEDANLLGATVAARSITLNIINETNKKTNGTGMRIPSGAVSRSV